MTLHRKITNVMLAAIVTVLASGQSIASTDSIELAHYTFEGNLVNQVDNDDLLEVYGSISYSTNSVSTDMDGRPGSIRLGTEDDHISLVTDELPVHKNDVLEMRAILRIDTRSKDRPDLPIVTLHEVLSRHRPLVLLSHQLPSFLNHVNRRQWHELSVMFYDHSILVKLDDHILNVMSRPPAPKGVILEHEIVLSHVFGYVDDVSLTYYKNAAPQEHATIQLADASFDANLNTIPKTPPETSDTTQIPTNNTVDTDTNEEFEDVHGLDTIAPPADRTQSNNDKSGTRYVKISIGTEQSESAVDKDNEGNFDSQIIVKPSSKKPPQPEQLLGAGHNYPPNTTTDTTTDTTADTATDQRKAQEHRSSAINNEAINNEPANEGSVSNNDDDHQDIVLIGDAPETVLPSAAPSRSGQQQIRSNDSPAVSLPTPTPVVSVGYNGQTVDPRAPYLNRQKQLPDSYQQGGQPGSVYIDNDITNSMVNSTNPPLTAGNVSIRTPPLQSNEFQRAPQRPLTEQDASTTKVATNSSSTPSTTVNDTVATPSAMVADSSQPGTPRHTVEQTIDHFQGADVDLNTDYSVVSWFKLDQDSYDSRSNASPALLHGQAYLDDSFFHWPDANSKAAIRFSEFGDALSSRVSVHSVLRPSGANTVSIEAMFFAEQWSLNGSTATRLFGVVSQPGTELSLVSEGDFLSVQAGSYRSDSNQTIKDALTPGMWHHVKLTMMHDTWELHINGESLLNGRVLGDGLEHWAPDKKINIVAGGFRGWLDDLVVRSSFGQSLNPKP